jgi:hypothetical protein
LENQQHEKAKHSIVKVPHVREGKDHEYDDGVVDAAVNPDPPGL